MPSAAVKRYWDWVRAEHPACPCGFGVEQLHHIIHINRQRITKDDMLVVGLCAKCHADLHALGGERQFSQETGLDPVHLAVLRRHNWEVRG